jgi:bisanhydrobacterioruberin hydratase
MKKNYTNLLIAQEKYAKPVAWFFVLFYLVGIAGLMIPETFQLFIKLFPFALLLSFAGIVLFHGKPFDRKTIFTFAGIYLAGFIIEAIGVNTGIIFGFYRYGSALGPKIFETPLIIGLNWLLLVYISAALFEKLAVPIVYKIILASLAMLVYDILLEQVAPKLDMWYWKTQLVPQRNYIAWFLIALFFHSIFRLTGIETNNRLFKTLFYCQLFFFVIIYLNFYAI